MTVHCGNYTHSTLELFYQKKKKKMEKGWTVFSSASISCAASCIVSRNLETNLKPISQTANDLKSCRDHLFFYCIQFLICCYNKEDG